MSATAQDVADQLVARIRVKKESIESLPAIPPNLEQRANLAGQIEGLSQALAMVQRLL